MITKTCLGFSATIVVAATIAELEILSRLVLNLRTILLLNLIAGMSGLIVFIAARALKARKGETSPEDRAKGALDLDYHPLHFLRELNYWGAIATIVASVSCVVIVFSFLMKPKVTVNARNVAPQATAPVKFPPMQIQGIVLREALSSVMIDHKIYFLGDYIGDVRVVAIDKDSVTLELSGQTNVLVLPK